MLAERADTVLLSSVYPQAALVLGSAPDTPQPRARGSVPAVPSAGTAVPGLCDQGTTEALGYVEICLRLLLYLSRVMVT